MRPPASRPEADYQAGWIDLTPAPPGLRALFEEFEEAVTGQMFSLVDDIQARIAALVPQAEFADGSTALIDNLQVYPSTGDVSFVAPVSAPV